MLHGWLRLAGWLAVKGWAILPGSNLLRTIEQTEDDIPPHVLSSWNNHSGGTPFNMRNDK